VPAGCEKQSFVSGKVGIDLRRAADGLRPMPGRASGSKRGGDPDATIVLIMRRAGGASRKLASCVRGSRTARRRLQQRSSYRNPNECTNRGAMRTKKDANCSCRSLNGSGA